HRSMRGREPGPDGSGRVRPERPSRVQREPLGRRTGPPVVRRGRRRALVARHVLPAASAGESDAVQDDRLPSLTRPAAPKRAARPERASAVTPVRRPRVQDGPPSTAFEIGLSLARVSAAPVPDRLVRYLVAAAP